MTPWISMLVDNKYGAVHNEGGARVVIEEFLEGEEASFIVLCDGKNVAALATSQDHKRLQRRRPGVQHGRHGRLFACPVVTADVRPRHARNHPAHHPGAWKRTHPLHRLPYAGPDDRRPGPAQDAGINRRMGDPKPSPS